MKKFFEEYGGVALGILALLVLIAMITPIGNIIKTSLAGISTKFGDSMNSQLDKALADRELENMNEEERFTYMADKIQSSRGGLDSGTIRTYRFLTDDGYLDKNRSYTPSTGFISPVPGAAISAGVWSYPDSFGGGTHLGVDYAVAKGTDIIAPANSILLISSDKCSYTGYLGDTCGGAVEVGEEGTHYGGNEIYLMTSVNNKVYAISFFHMNFNSLIKLQDGAFITQGTKIGEVGSTGNSTGPHCHIEVFYLGNGSFTDIIKTGGYLDTEYTLSFNAGWGDYALDHRCNGSNTECRMNPDDLW